jgi:hypothetical protein
MLLKGATKDKERRGAFLERERMTDLVITVGWHYQELGVG